jgi:NAD(P)-dependent dehydrogenase (short-subunit alcohol dehydrogenase family)
MVQQRVVLVTGCTEGGLGHCICRAFALSGCKVYATGRCKDLIKLAQLGCVELELDVTDAAGISRVVQQVLQENGRIDIGEAPRRSKPVCILSAVLLSSAAAAWRLTDWTDAI